MKKHLIEIQKKARYYTAGANAANCSRVLLAAHGYGMSAERFAQKLETVLDGKTCLIVPEGLYRYYIDNAHKKVGAHWMTKEERLDDIADNVRYLERVLADCGIGKQTPVTALGFSQGTHTLLRFSVRTEHNIRHFISWGSHIPADVLEEEFLPFFQRARLTLAWGNEDEFISPDKMQMHAEELNDKGVPFELVKYNGRHKIETDVLRDLLTEKKN